MGREGKAPWCSESISHGCAGCFGGGGDFWVVVVDLRRAIARCITTI